MKATPWKIKLNMLINNFPSPKNNPWPPEAVMRIQKTKLSAFVQLKIASKLQASLRERTCLKFIANRWERNGGKLKLNPKLRMKTIYWPLLLLRNSISKIHTPERRIVMFLKFLSLLFEPSTISLLTLDIFQRKYNLQL